MYTPEPQEFSLRTRLYALYVNVFKILFGTPQKKAISFSIILIVFALYVGLYRAPAHFPAQEILEVREGMTIEEVTQYFKEEGVIRSPFLFRSAVIILGGDRGALAGEYYFDKHIGAFSVAYRVTQGIFGIDPVRVQIPEGFTIEQIAERLDVLLDEDFDAELFLSYARAEEGYLFPDTYYLPPNTSELAVVRTMKDTFDARIQEIQESITTSGRSLEDIVTMASIIEREADERFETKQNVSSVLWNRIDIGMALQVDAAFVYFLGKGTAELTLEDLQIDSPYNTYVNTGLTPTPISNPGLDSLKAAATPAETEYFYYLTGNNGITYFSETFDEHVRKKALYLN